MVNGAGAYAGLVVGAALDGWDVQPLGRSWICWLCSGAASGPGGV